MVLAHLALLLLAGGREHRIQPGEVVLVKIWRADGSLQTVTPEGDVTVPNVGKIRIAQMTQVEAARIIQVALRPVMEDPRVIVAVFEPARRPRTSLPAQRDARGDPRGAPSR